MTTKIEIKTATRKQLATLPTRKWDSTEESYDSLLIFSSNRNHDSGWSAITIVGCRDNRPVEILTVCSDDIEWIVDLSAFGQMRMDCTSKSGILHAWSRSHRFHVGPALSSIDIKVIKK